MFSVVFDMDGTLLDTQKICIPAWEYAGRLLGISDMGKRVYDVFGMNETGWTDYLRNNFKALDISAFKSEARKYISENLVIKFKPGALELLEFLKENNIKIALASGSSRETINHNLKSVNAEKYFDAIVGGYDVKNGKPAPDVFILAAEKLGVLPEECFVIEDSANGIIAGYKAGMRCIGIPDILEFNAEIKKLMFASSNSLLDVIEIFKALINDINV